jgi:SAM-dependent methyltransferase
VPWLRDNYVCLNCFSIPRQRHIQHILDSFFSGWESRAMHESSPSNNLLAQYCPSYTGSQYLPDTPIGTEKNGVRCENLEQLTFADGSFDCFVTQDVFEHIFNPNLAAREIMRVLRPGGIHIFTAPKHKGIHKSYQRARLVNNHIEHVMEEQYHGNPVGDGRALVTWDYGDDFEFLLAEWSQYPTTTFRTRDRSLGLDGEFLEVFVTRKPTA